VTNVMHSGLPRVITQDTRNHNDLFSFREPSFLTTKVTSDSMTLRLSGGGRKIEPCENSKQGSESALDCKKISPSFPPQTRVPTQMQNSVGKEGGDDVGGNVRSPKPSETGWEFFVLVEIAQVENDL
jgi:hypothetical protein